MCLRTYVCMYGCMYVYMMHAYIHFAHSHDCSINVSNILFFCNMSSSESAASAPPSTPPVASSPISTPRGAGSDVEMDEPTGSFVEVTMDMISGVVLHSQQYSILDTLSIGHFIGIAKEKLGVGEDRISMVIGTEHFNASFNNTQIFRLEVVRDYLDADGCLAIKVIVRPPN